MLALRDSEVLQSEPAGEGLSPAEMERLTSLDQWWKDNGESAPAGGVAAAPGESGRGSIDAELGSVKEWMYFQLTAKVSHCKLFLLHCPIIFGLPLLPSPTLAAFSTACTLHFLACFALPFSCLAMLRFPLRPS